ncbi:D-3-phosphoglycerate dehydrogenase [Candidatus Magnetoovum chiemensis]|nr:D-3-phosphoglycerate dehydrogenase [Candidatus Magnetoovum chiemensis]
MNNILISTSSFKLKDEERLLNLKEQALNIIFNPHGRRLTETEAETLLSNNVVGIIAGVEPLTRSVIEKSTNLKVISRCGIGLESVDLIAAKENNILVYNTPTGPVKAVAELTIGLMLSVLRRVCEADKNLRKGIWKPLMGHLLSAQTVGIIGYGNIGKEVSKLARAFGANVIVYDVNNIDPNGIKATSFDELLKSSDIITVHLPYNQSTHNLINNDNLQLLKKGVILINTSRGGIIAEETIVDGIKNGHIAGAGIDAYNNEPYKGPLTELDQVILTSHMGSYAQEARVQMESDAISNLLKGLKEKGLIK